MKTTAANNLAMRVYAALFPVYTDPVESGLGNLTPQLKTDTIAKDNYEKINT